MSNATSRNLSNERHATILISLLLAFFFFITLYIEMPLIINEYKVNDDFRQHIYWMAKFQDSELFENDPLTEEIIFQNYLNNRGFVYLYEAMSYIIEPILFAKILPLILVPISVFYLFRLGRLIESDVAGLLLPLLSIPFMEDVLSGGIQRSFAFPLLVSFLYYCIKKEYIKTAIILALQCLFYPPIFLISAPTFALSFFYYEKVTKRNTIKFALIISPCLVILAPSLLFQLTSTKEPLSMAIFEPGGRLAQERYMIYTESELLDISAREIMALLGTLLGGKVTFGDIAPLFAIAFSFFLILGPRFFTLEREIWYLLFVSLALFIVSWIFFPLVYFPARYVIGVHVFGLILLAKNFESAREEFYSLKRKRNIHAIYFSSALPLFIGILLSPAIVAKYISPFLSPGSLSRYGGLTEGTVLKINLWRSGLVILGGGGILLTSFRKRFSRKFFNNFLLVSFIIFLCIFNLPRISDPGNITPPQEQVELYDFISTLPRDVLIAGNPQEEYMSDIPLFAKRSVFINHELHSMLSISGESKHIQERIYEFFNAYYSDSAEDIASFCEKNKVDYLVINTEHFFDNYLEQKNFYYEPYNDFVIKKIDEGRRFALTEIPEEKHLFRRGHISVVKCDEKTAYNS